MMPLSDVIDIKLQRQICADLSRHLHQTAVCDEFLDVLRDIVNRFENGHRARPDPILAAEIRDAILEQYRLLRTRCPRGRRAC